MTISEPTAFSLGSNGLTRTPTRTLVSIIDKIWAYYYNCCRMVEVQYQGKQEKAGE
jgi:hypothetical protein